VAPTERINKFFTHQEKFIYLVAEFTGKTEEVRQHITGCGPVDAQLYGDSVIWLERWV
jgi:sarcosine oxidase delta subunit